MITKNSVVKMKSLGKRAKAQKQATKESTANSTCIAKAGTIQNNRRCDGGQ